MRSGDWGNLFILANSGFFLASVILQNAGVVDWHSASFVEDGFCVSDGEFPHTPSTRDEGEKFNAATRTWRRRRAPA